MEINYLLGYQTMKVLGKHVKCVGEKLAQIIAVLGKARTFLKKDSITNSLL